MASKASNGKKKKKKRVNPARILRAALIVLVICAAGTGGYMLFFEGIPDQSRMQVLFDAGTIRPTTSINGVDVSNMTPAQARIAINEQVLQKAEGIAVKLQYTDRIDTLAAEKIGVYPDADDTVREAMQSGREGGITQRKNTAVSGTVKALTLSYVYDENALEQNIRNAAAQLNTAPIEPEVSVTEDDKLVITDGKDGIDLDVDTFVALVKAAVIDGTFGPVKMPGTPILPTYSTEEIRENTVLITSSTTIFTDASTSGRAMNIKKMCDILSGQVVLPGEEFSVNDTAGARTLANGWYMAKGYENGLVTDQPGGGICQVSTTLYNSLLKADLEITARRPHSMLVHYVDRALDATVNTGGPDLAFKNNTDYPIYIILRVDESKGTAKGVNKKVIVEIYGQPLPDGMTIKLLSVDKVHTAFDPLDVVYVTDPELVRSGRDHYVSEAWKIYLDADGKEIKRTKANTSTYAGSKPYVLEGTTPSPSLSPSPSPSASPTS